MTTWAGLEDATAAMRRLNQAISGHYRTDAELSELAAALRHLAESIEGGERRDKLADMSTRPHLAQLYADERAPLVIGEGEEVEFDPFSPFSGIFHPYAAELRFHRRGDEAIGRVVLGPGFAGPPERAHGGVVAGLIDETMGALNRIHGRRAFTGSLTIDYRAAAPLDVEIELRAWFVGQQGRKITLACEGTGPDGVFVESRGLFIAPADLA